MDAKQSKLAQRKAEAEGGKDCHGKNEDKSLEESRHAHHRGSPMGKQAAHSIDAMIPQEVRGGGYWGDFGVKVGLNGKIAGKLPTEAVADFLKDFA
jgi:hypothetical protein